jgi:imidazole glycerol phosphate synthase glutamine amidotransferase subunit
VLPGVGAFADCMKGLSAVPGMVEALREKVLKDGAPFLGICVGMQLLATVGVEFGDHAGLGWIAGEVVKITPDDPNLKIPHMGWNELKSCGSTAAGRHRRPARMPISCIPSSSSPRCPTICSPPPIMAGR